MHLLDTPKYALPVVPTVVGKGPGIISKAMQLDWLPCTVERARGSEFELDLPFTTAILPLLR